MDQQSYQVTQQIEGLNHQIAGRDIVNHWTIEPNQPESDFLNTIDELRAQRDLSKEIIRNANAKISASLPAKILKVTVSVFMILVLILASRGPEFFWAFFLRSNSYAHWYYLAFILGIIFPALAFYKLANRQLLVVERERKRLDEIHCILSNHKIDEL